jgi:hypothetical protein
MSSNHGRTMRIRSLGMPNAIDMLKADHEKVKELFHHYEAAGDRAHQKKKSIAEEVFTELEVHTILEEEIFYPAMKLKSLDPKDERYDAKFKVLRENVEHHIEEEEEEMLPEAEEVIGAQLQRLSRRMQERKEELMVAFQNAKSVSRQ